VTIKNVVFWDVALCRSWVNQRFGGTYRLHPSIYLLFHRFYLGSYGLRMGFNFFTTKFFTFILSSVLSSNFKKILLERLKCISYYETSVRFLGNNSKNKDMWFYDVIVGPHSMWCCVQTIAIKSGLVKRKK
jgi:hypothetical protein